MTDIYSGAVRLPQANVSSRGELIERDGESYYKIHNVDAMPPFFMSVISNSDHWMFVSSTGGLSCGRKSPEQALFPYYTDDKIHDSTNTTGPYTSMLVERDKRLQLWQPFIQGLSNYRIERHLYKNVSGNKLMFEEINHDLELVFSYCWSNSEKYGFVKHSKLQNLSEHALNVRVLDGLRNILPFGVTQALQANMSTLVDAYKQAELQPQYGAGIYSLSSILTDRAEPSEALKSTLVWQLGLKSCTTLLSEQQLQAFTQGQVPSSENLKRGIRSAYFTSSQIHLDKFETQSWLLLADIHQGPCELEARFAEIDRGLSIEEVLEDVELGQQKLFNLVGDADGFQYSSDKLSTRRHFSNTLFNIMRGGIFYRAYVFPSNDFLDFVESWHGPLLQKYQLLLASLGTEPTLHQVTRAAAKSGDPDMQRLALEYLPLIFSRRHGDPSRPWNKFSIDIKSDTGEDKLYYEGNWRDIFQNWESLAHSYPKFIESIIAKFVNASTADGYNPYRITKDGIDWETFDPEDPWSNIGYWGDHQIIYLQKLLEFSHNYHPGKLKALFDREIFVYADVPYRIKNYETIRLNPRDTISYDDTHAEIIAQRSSKLGADGKLVTDSKDQIHHVTLLEKILLPTLAKLNNFVPGGGIWMNTQRPEWNDANNALVGYGLSMVTLYYLRRALKFLNPLIDNDAEYQLSTEVQDYFDAIFATLEKHSALLSDGITPSKRLALVDELGTKGDRYRKQIYGGFSGSKKRLSGEALHGFISLATAYLDQTIGLSRRQDGLYQSYNLIDFQDEQCLVTPLYEMLEGQVAVMSSGYLDSRQCLSLLDSLKCSAMYRADQNSYMLYPARKLAAFLQKNIISPELLEHNSSMQTLLHKADNTIIECDGKGVFHFNAALRNANELRHALAEHAELDQTAIEELCLIYEQVFKHREFTGRSGTFYKYEGLGCIYWHMVSKLLLATNEVLVKADQADPETYTKLRDHFADIKDGLGVRKAPQHYGAFPTDPYSHTPDFCGAQQPGMTGQVKEDFITRFAELGVIIRDGIVQFAPYILNRSEFIEEDSTWSFYQNGNSLTLPLKAGSLAFTLCGVPIIYKTSDRAAIEVNLSNGQQQFFNSNVLPSDLSESIFLRDGRIKCLEVDIPLDTLC